MEKKTVFALAALLVVGLAMTTGIASAYRGDYTTKGPYYNEERYSAMQEAFETGDYDAWYALMTEDGRHPRVVDVITEENFAKFAEAHEAAEAGDYEKAASIRAELGLNNGQGPRDGTGRMMGRGRGKGMQMHQNNFVDADNDGVCDNMGSGRSRGRVN